MRIEYLYAEDCPICMGMKKQGVTPAIRRVFAPFRDIHFIDGIIDEIDEYLALEDGEVTRKTAMTAPMMESIVDRREDGYQGLGTPMMHLVDPVAEKFEEVFVADLFSTDTELQETLRDDPWLLKRMITKRVWRFYTEHCVGVPTETSHKIRDGLQPDYERLNFQDRRWQDAFRRAQEPTV